MSRPCLARSWTWSSSLSVLRVTERVYVLLLSFSKQREEIAELRQECSDLRQSNQTLERQVKEGIVAAVCVLHASISTQQRKANWWAANA